jgi:hypothetical protein
MARALNASITRDTVPLCPLKTSADEGVDGFPETLNDLNTLTSMKYLPF